MTNRWLQAAYGLALLLALAHSLPAAEITVVKPNGGWCWFQGERAVVVADKVFFTSIAGTGRGDGDAGDLVATCFDPHTKQTQHFVLHAGFQQDDHDVAGLCVLPDSRLLAVYGKHGNDHQQRWRISRRAADVSDWTDEATLDVGDGYTYANVYRLSAEDNRIYNFHRGRGYNPNCTISDDGGVSWRYGWRLLQWTRKDLENDPRFTGLDGGRPYLRYTSNGTDSIHFIVTDDHPRAYDNSLYHGYYREGRLHTSDGRALATPASESDLKPRSFTEVFAGGPDRVAWASDLQLDSQGHPYIVFSVQVDGAAVRRQRAAGGFDHRYYYGRWDGARWLVHPLAYAGTKLYAGEDDYTGLAALDPQDPNTVVISTNADPLTGTPLKSAADGKRHWELYRGTTTDGGATWHWTAITENSSSDQLRPVIPARTDGPRITLWTRGTLTSYTDFDLDVVALVEDRR